MPNSYLDNVMSKAQYEHIEDGTWFGLIPGFDGLWANAPTEEMCQLELRDTLKGWILLAFPHHSDLPIISDVTYAVENQANSSGTDTDVDGCESNEKSEFWTLVDKLFREMTPGAYEQAYAEGFELGKREALAEYVSIRLMRKFGKLTDDMSFALCEAPSNTLEGLLDAMNQELTLSQVREHLGLEPGL